MQLTGKAKVKFEEWWMGQPNTHTDHRNIYLVYGSSSLVRLDSIPQSMQWGVYEDWADSMGCFINIDGSHELYFASIIYRGEYFSEQYWQDYTDEFEPRFYATRQEARNAAIEKLNELINEQ
jgi:hypothetical protein